MNAKEKTTHLFEIMGFEIVNHFLNTLGSVSGVLRIGLEATFSFKLRAHMNLSHRLYRLPVLIVAVK
jgi:hypothetical protein